MLPDKSCILTLVMKKKSHVLAVDHLHVDADDNVVETVESLNVRLTYTASNDLSKKIVACFSKLSAYGTSDAAVLTCPDLSEIEATVKSQIKALKVEISNNIPWKIEFDDDYFHILIVKDPLPLVFIL